MGTIITAATILATYISSTANINSQYCYNADIENGQVKTMYVYDKDGQALSGKLEYRSLTTVWAALPQKRRSGATHARAA